MENKGISIMPLHYGHPPEYLYKRMVKLGGIISDIIIKNYDTGFFIKKLSDPFWFHSFSLAIGFDWNSSGTTTATLGALKEYANKNDDIRIIGGKGRHLNDIKNEFNEVINNGNIDEKTVNRIKTDAKLMAKTDEKFLQDNFDLYMQFIIMDYNGNYSIINQGMNKNYGLARRYHWIKNNKNFLNDGRNGISGYENNGIMDLSTSKSEDNKRDIIDVIKDNPLKYSKQKSLDNYMENLPVLNLNYKIDWNQMRDLYEYNPDNFNELLNVKGLKKSTVRSLSYIAELIYGDKPSFTDPVKYSFCLGGKDGVPKPVNKYDYDKTIEFYDEILKGNQYYGAISKRLSKMSYELSNKN